MGNLKIIILKLLFVCIGLIFLNLVKNDLMFKIHVLSDGTKTQGNVIDFKKDISVDNKTKKVSKTYVLVYSYIAQDGRTYTKKERIYTNLRNYSIGDKIHIIYNTNNPDNSIINDLIGKNVLIFIYSLVGILFIIIGIMIGNEKLGLNILNLIFICGGVLFFYFGINDFMSKNDMLLKGTKTQGTVINLHEKISKNKKTYGISKTYAPVYSYVARDGKKYINQSNLYTNPPDYSIGDKINIKYDPKNPQESISNNFFGEIGFTVIFCLIGSVFILSQVFDVKNFR